MFMIVGLIGRQGSFAAIIATVSGLLALSACQGQATPPAAQAQLSISDQVATGQQVFARRCAGCHGQNGEGVKAPALVGPGSLSAYGNAQELFNFIKTYMPANAAGSLQAEEYWALAAFVLKQNGVLPQSAKALGPDTAPGVALKR